MGNVQNVGFGDVFVFVDITDSICSFNLSASIPLAYMYRNASV
jgi:hypothetical protein